jgi:hypothetical protein
MKLVEERVSKPQQGDEEIQVQLSLLAPVGGQGQSPEIGQESILQEVPSLPKEEVDLRQGLPGGVRKKGMQARD